jgi:hypothetical protein
MLSAKRRRRTLDPVTPRHRSQRRGICAPRIGIVRLRRAPSAVGHTHRTNAVAHSPPKTHFSLFCSGGEKKKPVATHTHTHTNTSARTHTHTHTHTHTGHASRSPPSHPSLSLIHLVLASLIVTPHSAGLPSGFFCPLFAQSKNWVLCVSILTTHRHPPTHPHHPLAARSQPSLRVARCWQRSRTSRHLCWPFR